MVGKTIASKADIIARESLGYSHLVWRGQSYFVNLASKTSKENFRRYLEEQTNEDWRMTKDNVFYRVSMYAYLSGELRLRSDFCGKVEMPINAKDCTYLFTCADFSKLDLSELDTSEVVVARGMFSGCSFKEPIRFDTSNMENMKDMFSYCRFPEGYQLDLDCSSAKDMSSMFFRCIFGRNVKVKLNSGSVENVASMFQHAFCREGFSFEMNTDNVQSMSLMFTNCVVSDDFCLPMNFKLAPRADCMFTGASLPKRVTATTIEGKVEQLKIMG